MDTLQCSKPKSKELPFGPFARALELKSRKKHIEGVQVIES
jgi:hypothetical protein